MDPSRCRTDSLRHAKDQSLVVLCRHRFGLETVAVVEVIGMEDELIVVVDL